MYCLFMLLGLLTSCNQIASPVPATEEQPTLEVKKEALLQLKDIGVNSLDAWFASFPPMGGESQWKDGRSAKELGKGLSFLCRAGVHASQLPFFLKIKNYALGHKRTKSAASEDGNGLSLHKNLPFRHDRAIALTEQAPT